MATYVDGFVLAVPKKKLPAYLKMSRESSHVWRKYGALDYRECVGDDLNPKGFKFPFTKAFKCKPGETIVFSYIVYKSRDHRDKVNAKVMKDPFIQKYIDKPMPFDMKRMAYGGFKVAVSF